MVANINRLYIHVPFCRSKCAYCAFHSIPILDGDPLIDQYLAKLEKDVKESRNLTSPLESIYIGGGTPSCLKTDHLEQLFTIISENFSISENAEISIENNPESLTEEKIKIISSFANRVSLGVQAFNKEQLKILGRAGENEKINQIIDTCGNNGVNNISIDLIYGIPTQTIKDWEGELQTALKLPIKHISAYSLTYEEGTKLYSESKSNSNDQNDLTAEMWLLSSEFLEPKLKRYEISNYAQTGYECKHNLDIWFGGTYLGLGPTASSFDGKTRWTQQNLHEWLAGEKPEIDAIPYSKRIGEIFIMGLRTTYGWMIKPQANGDYLLQSSLSSNNLMCIKKQDWDDLSCKLKTLQQNKLLELTSSESNSLKITSTQKGLLLWNEIALELV